MCVCVCVCVGRVGPDFIFSHLEGPIANPGDPYQNFKVDL